MGSLLWPLKAGAGQELAGTVGSKGSISPIRDVRNSLGPELNEGACKVIDYFAGERKSPSFDDVFGKSTEVE